MVHEKPQKLSELLARDEREFAKKITAIVDENYEAFRPYRDKCWRNERVWRTRHWDEKAARGEEDAKKPRPNVPVMHSAVENCVADVMDNYPDAIIRGVNGDDDVKGLIATELVRFIMQRARHRVKYKKKVRSALKVGTGTLRTFWNPDLADGMGDIDYEYLNIDDVVWDKNAADVNDGRFFAVRKWATDEDLYEAYPDIDLNECEPEDENSKEPRDNSTEDIALSEKEGLNRVIHVMWKEREPRTVEREEADGAKATEQMGRVTIINSAVVIGTYVAESHINQYTYDRYGIEMTPHVELEGWPVGLSVIDLNIDDANTINMIEQQYLCNLQASAEDRFLVKRTANIDQNALLDYKQKIIQGDSINPGAVFPFRPTQFSGQALNFQSAKIGGVKERTGQDVFNIGGVKGGVTSGIGIQELKDSGSKRSRLDVDDNYEAYKLTVKDTLMLAKAHYTTQRVFRISRESQHAIEKLLEKAQASMAAAVEQGANAKQIKSVLPEGVTITGNEISVDFSQFSLDFIDLDYDIEIVPQRQSPATSAAINNMVAAFANNGTIPLDLGFELTEFADKEKFIKKIRERNDIEQRMQTLSQQAEQAVEQTEKVVSMLEKSMKEAATLQKQLWEQKIKNALQQVADRGKGKGTEGGPAPETAEEALMRIQAEINSA